MLKKVCKYCNKIFEKPYNVSKASWFGNKKRPEGVQYCSKQCASISKKDKKFTLEHRKKISKGLKKAYSECNRVGFIKGKSSWNKGLTKDTDERVARQANNLKGKKVTEEKRQKISKALIGRYKGKDSPSWNGGKIEKTCLFCGKKYSVFYYRKDESKYCSRKCHSTDYLHTTPIKHSVRHSDKYKQWRQNIFERDNYTCQQCGQRGGNIVADHIEAFSLLWISNNIETFNEALLCNELWNLDNGRTLCNKCHEMTDNYGGNSTKINRKIKQVVA